MAGRASIDISDMPELRQVAEEARTRQEPTGVLTQEQFDAVMSAAGSWEGLIDVDEFLEETYASRGSSRSSVDL